MKFLITLALIISYGIVFGQHRFRHLDIEDGLSENAVTDFFQDSEGYMWISTQDGLNLYDGYSIKQFSSTGKEGYKLSDNFLWGIVEDNHGMLWCGSRNGLNRIDKKSGKITCYFYDNESLLQSFNQVVATAYHHGYIYASFQGKLTKIATESKPEGENQLIELKDISPGFYTGFITPSGHDEIFAIDSSSILNIATGNRISLSGDADGENYSMYKSAKAIGNKQWFTSYRGVHCLDLESKSVKKLSYDFQGATIYDVQPVKDQVWVATSSGIYVFKDFAFQRIIRNDVNQANSLSSNVVETLFQDNLGRVWIGPGGKGINIYDPRHTQFKFLDKTAFGDDIIVRSVCRTSDKLLVASNKGVHVADIKGDPFTAEFSIDQFSTFEKLQLDNQSSLDINAIEEIDNYILMGSREGRLYVLDSTLTLIKSVLLSEEILNQFVITDILKRKNGNIWVSTFKGVYILDESFSVLKSFRDNEPANGLGTSYFLTLFEDSRADMWLGSNRGIHRYDNPTEKFISYPYDKTQLEDGPGFNFISGFADIGDDNLWIGTYGGGLSKFNLSTKKFKHFTTENGLVNNVVNGVQATTNNQLWLSTNKGLAHFNPHSGEIINYDRSDGIFYNEFNLNANCNWKKEEFYFGTPAGLVLFKPEQISLSNRQPNIVISSIWINYKEENSRINEGQLNIYPADKALAFHFAGLNYSESSKISYEYQLEGYNENWISVSSNNLTASYTSLPAGNYKFRIRCTNESGIWSENEAMINIQVFPPIYATWWFISLTALVLITLGILIVRYLAQKKIKKRLALFKVQQAMQEQKQKISRDLHDNIGAQMTYLISSIDQESYKTPENVEVFDELGDKARNVMTELRQTIWVMNKESISLDEFVVRLKEYVAKVLRDFPMEGSIEFDDSDNITLTPSITTNLFRVVQEAINNSMKHAAATLFQIEIKIIEGKLILELKDNGKGFEQVIIPDDHFGLKNMKFRMEENGGTFSISSEGKNKGTHIRISLPV